MSHLFVVLSALSLIGLAAGQIASYENADGSYSIGHNSNSNGDTANSVLALLTKAAGYTTNEHLDYEEDDYREEEKAQNVQISSSATFVKPHLEILRLLEGFMRLKREFASRVYLLVADNYELFASVFHLIVSKVGKLHTFTLVGIQILRKIIEFALPLVVQWQKPSVSVAGQVMTNWFN